ncbi:MAG: cysteine desulfurase family protein [Candidatus Moranbacteria bacterium]|jgi:cysteine desulfurase|nr:cysteine desulfurase family protein [Candidatus Moranbacteria bacterium]MDD5651877.1 cysteine desulfurase family protein [Candidatus Moranbacteria bacterium]MDX9855233.1 cysteine desulfurase family protein [Candidatus Moranbacteria bacterium]
MNKKIYLDHAATTSLDKRVFRAMEPYFREKFGNPSSVHSFGQEAMFAIEKSRKEVARFLNCSDSEIIFTSGATESNNLAVRGVIEKYWEEMGKNAPIPHIITSAIEHHCVLDTAISIKKMGLVELSILPVHKNEGIVAIEDLKGKIKDNTILVSIMYVNNEIGTVQPIEEIGEFIKEINKERKNKIMFHTDAVQAVNYFDCNTKKLNTDMLSFSGHKIYGPKGAGVLFIKKGTPLKPIQFGGGQEYRIRPGTQNVPAIVGIGKAVEMIGGEKSEVKNRIKKLRDYLVNKVLKEIPDSYLNGSKEKRSPNNANFRFDNVEGEGLLIYLDMEGISASTGSACSSGSLEPSHVLLALGIKHEQAHGSLRITLGKNNTKEELDIFIKKLKKTVERLRKISGDVLKDFDK